MESTVVEDLMPTMGERARLVGGETERPSNTQGTPIDLHAKSSIPIWGMIVIVAAIIIIIVVILTVLVSPYKKREEEDSEDEFRPKPRLRNPRRFAKGRSRRVRPRGPADRRQKLQASAGGDGVAERHDVMVAETRDASKRFAAREAFEPPQQAELPPAHALPAAPADRGFVPPPPPPKARDDMVVDDLLYERLANQDDGDEEDEGLPFE